MPTDPIPALSPKAYYRADAGTWQDSAGTTAASTSGAAIARWDDQSGNGNHLGQSTAGARPTFGPAAFNGLPGVVFANANSTFLENTAFPALSGKSAATVFVLLQTLGYTTSFSTAAGLQIDRGSTSYYGVNPGAYARDAADVVRPPVVIAFRFDGTQANNADRVKVWRSSQVRALTVTGTIAASLASSNGVRVGRPWGTANQYQDGPIASIAVFDRALSDAEVGQVNDYLRDQWFPDRRPQVFFCGDSLTVSYNQNSSPYPTGVTYPEALRDSLGSGWDCETDLARNNQSAEVGAQIARVSQLFDSTVAVRHKSHRTRNMAFLWCGTNDLANGTSAATAYAAFLSFATKIAGQGIEVIPVTVLPRDDDGPSVRGSAFETVRNSFNSSIRNQTSPPWSHILDLDARLPTYAAASAVNDSTRYIDRVHLTKQGYADVAGAEKSAMQDWGYTNSPPATPTITAGTITDSGATLTGSAFSDADSGDTHAASQWQVTATADTGFATPVVSTGDTSTSKTSYAATGLAMSTAYRARVRYKDSAGNYSAWSTPATFTTAADTTPPGVPTGLAAKAGDTLAYLTWSAPSGEAVANYKLRRGGTVAYTGSALSYLDTGRTNGSALSYTVSAVDAAGNESAQSSAVSVTPNPPGVGAAYTAASNVRSGTDRGDGTLGTLAVPSAGSVRSGTAVDAGTGTLVVPTLANTKVGVAGDGGTGTYDGSDRWTALSPNLVASGTAYKSNSTTNNQTGTYDPVAGNYTDPGAANVAFGTVYKFAGSNLTGTYSATSPTYLAANVVKVGVDRGDGTPGTYDGSDRWTDPGVANVASGVAYKAGSTSNNRTGTFDPVAGNYTDPGANKVQLGATYKFAGSTITGTFGGSDGTYPTAAQVLAGVSFGPTGSPSTGTVVLPSAGDVLAGTQFGPGGGTTGTLATSGGSYPTANQVADAVLSRPFPGSPPADSIAGILGDLPTVSEYRSEVSAAVLQATVDGETVLKVLRLLRAEALGVTDLTEEGTAVFMRPDGVTEAFRGEYSEGVGRSNIVVAGGA